jgi:putative endonuclease
MANQSKITIGKQGEELAAAFLEKKGFTVVARNYRHKKAEVDLIVKKDNWLVFVEVKARSSSAYGEPEAFVDGKKARMIFSAAEEFIFANNWHGHVRFDVVSVKLGRDTEIAHFEDAIN